MPVTQPKARILVVDDIPATASSLATFLRHCGYDVRAVTTGLDAVTALVDWIPEVALIDLAAADGCGLEAAEALAFLDRPPLLVGLLRPATAGAIPRIKLAVFDQLFSKAVSQSTLAEIVARHLAKKTIRCEG